MTADRGIAVREVRPEEYERLGEITVDAYREVGETDEPYYATLRDVAARAADVPVLVAVDATTGELLGGVTYVPGPGRWAESERPDVATFRMLAIASAARGRGAGRALVGACIERARAAGFAEVAVITRPFMTAAHRLYESFGFERDPGGDWEFEPGEWLLGYRLEL